MARNSRRRDLVMGSHPGYRFRGTGNWIAPRAGSSYYKSMDDDMYYRGAGFKDWIKNAAKTAFNVLVKYVVPHVRESAPDLAKLMTNYAASKAADYVNRSERLGPAKGLISQALSDLPGVVKDIVKHQIENKFEPLTARLLQDLQERGGADVENRELMAQQAVIDAMPLIEEEILPLRLKLAMVENYGGHISNGNTRDAFSQLQHLSNILSKENSNGALGPLGLLLETMIVSVVQMLSKTNNMSPCIRGMCDSCSRMCSCDNTFSPIQNKVSSKIDMLRDLGLDLGRANTLAAFLPGLGSFEIVPDSNRGGFAVMPLLAAALPALVSGGVDLISRAISYSTSKGDQRGGAVLNKTVEELRDEMQGVFKDILQKVDAQNKTGISNKSIVHKRTTPLGGQKPSTKRLRIK